MDRDSTRPLTTAEAKARLRLAAEAATPTAWFKRYPLRAITFALVGGFVVARIRVPTATGLLLAQKLVVPLLINSIKGKQAK